MGSRALDARELRVLALDAKEPAEEPLGPEVLLQCPAVLQLKLMQRVAAVRLKCSPCLLGAW